MLNQTTKAMQNAPIKVPHTGELAVDKTRQEYIDHIKSSMVQPIDAIEFFELPDTEEQYTEVNIDQIYNVPSIVSSKVNAETWLNLAELSSLEPRQLFSIARMSELNSTYIVYNQIKSSVVSNLARFREENFALKSFGLKINPESWEDQDVIDFCNVALLHLREVFSIYKDSPEQLDSSRALLNNIINQVYIRLSGAISFDIERQLVFALKNYTYEDYGEIAKNIYPDVYKSMEVLFLQSADESLKLLIKQVVALDLYAWFSSVLFQIVFNTINGYFCLNSYLYSDFGKFMAESEKKEIEE